MTPIILLSCVWVLLTASVVLVVALATRASRRDMTLPKTWTPTRGDLRRHNREIREIRGT